MGGVIISPNPKKESVQIDQFGNEVIPFTKQVIKKNEEPIIKKVDPKEIEESSKNESILSGE